MRKIAIWSLMLMFLVSCATLPTGKTDWAESVVQSYVNLTKSVILAKGLLTTMEQQKYWTPEALVKVKAQYLMGKGDMYKAGDYVIAWLEDPAKAPWTMFPVLANQSLTVIGTIVGGRFEMKQRADAKLAGKFVMVPQKFFMSKKMAGPSGPLKLTVTPEMIEATMNFALVAINMISNYLDVKPEISSEQKLAFIARIQEAQKALPLWE